MHSHKTHALLATVTTVGALFVASLMAPAVQATAGAKRTQVAYTTQLTNVYPAPTFRTRMLGGMFRGTPVTLLCWKDADYFNGTNRWFRADGAGFDPFAGRPRFFRGAWVSANSITGQYWTPRCR